MSALHSNFRCATLVLMLGGGAVVPAAPAHGFHGSPNVNMQVYPVPIGSSGDWVLTQSWDGTGSVRRLVDSGAGRYYLRVVAPNLGWSLMGKEAR